MTECYEEFGRRHCGLEGVGPEYDRYGNLIKIRLRQPTPVTLRPSAPAVESSLGTSPPSPARG